MNKIVLNKIKTSRVRNRDNYTCYKLFDILGKNFFLIFFVIFGR